MTSLPHKTHDAEQQMLGTQSEQPVTKHLVVEVIPSTLVA